MKRKQAVRAVARGPAVLAASESRFSVFLLPVLFCVISVACGSPPAKEVSEQRLGQVSPQQVQQAQAVLQPLKEQLRDALLDALEAGGPVNAIQVCRLEAPGIAAAQSTGGVRVGRTSHRLRNPANAPAPWMEPLLGAYLEDPAGAAPRAVRIDEATVGYVEPIRLQAMCLTCHGPSVDPSLLEEIRRLYPEDRATGFQVDELRGMFWVTLPAPAV